MTPRSPARPPLVPWEAIASCLTVDTIGATTDDALFRFRRIQAPARAFTVHGLRATRVRAPFAPFEPDDGFLNLRVDGVSYAQLPLAALDIWFSLEPATLRIDGDAVLDVATDKPARVFVRGLAYRIRQGEGEK